MYQNKSIKCGKEKCNQCPHDGYIYVSFKLNNKTRTFYLGKLDKINESKIKEISDKVIREVRNDSFWAGMNIDVYGIHKFCTLYDVMIREFNREFLRMPLAD